MRSLLTIAALTIVSLAVAGRPARATDLPDISIRTKPYKVLLKAAMLLPQSGKPVLTAPEAALFEDASDGKVHTFHLPEVALICSGVTDQETRDHYIERIDEITEKARKAIAKGKTVNEKADLLAQHLYNGPLHGGYVDSQVDFLKLLDEGKFNCVSSSILYNMIAGQLDMKTNCVTLPNHVFLIMGDLVIEPVSGITCTQMQHQATVDKCWNDSPDFSKRYFDASHMYVSTNVDLIAEVYIDRSSELDTKEHRPAESAIEALKAICMDSKNPLFRQSAECQMGKWFQSAIDEHDVKLAGQIAKLYAELFANPPQASSMQRSIAETQAQLASAG